MVVRRHDPRTHTDRCAATTKRTGRPCSNLATRHVDLGLAGCGNYCGVHMRALYRASMGTALVDVPIRNGRRVT